MSTATAYIGNELELFQHARNWKTYFSAFFRPYVKGRVGEIGAGMGANVPFFMNPAVTKYVCIEPDPKLADAIGQKIELNVLPKHCTVKAGFLEDSVTNEYDTILYIDVLEHIYEDKKEIEKAANALKPGGHLCILVPANPADYTDFDKAIGHYRRYTKQTLIESVAPALQIQWCRYLDSFGSAASKVNRFFLKQSQPKLSQVLFWDRWLVPASRSADKLTGYRFGKSLLLVAKKRT